jgi:hypothetical protein
MNNTRNTKHYGTATTKKPGSIKGDCQWCKYENITRPAMKLRDGDKVCRSCAESYDDWLREEEDAARAAWQSEAYGPETVWDVKGRL